ncbi:alpha/beta fold hydrolase [Noviherbaspirillum saxi]|uniref:Alpha/beta hydrolase n=1 Tax=Noviherbaspirillum saxi TaxID=2320863 RepID=A0A3A3FKT1_9BURK|nr:alpha/beta hydrolase [Noviherbaspirillum saxi]RJF95804.1 alpha/beta hydrolase [Noviherbaspirillum saxi]
MRIIEANGLQLACDDQGDPNGEPLLLIAGLGLQLISWPDNFCKTLVDQGFRVIRFDNRDCGMSTKLSHLGKPHLHQAFFQSLFRMPLFSGYTLYDMAKDTIGLLDALEIRKAHIVGASMGGMIAQIIAARYPDRTHTLTSIMSTSGRPGLPGPSFAANNAVFSMPRNPRDINAVVEHFVHLFRVIGSPAYPTPEPLLRERVMESVRRNSTINGTSRQMMAVASSGDLVAQLRTIRLPALVIHGSDDPLVPVACGRDTARWIPGAIMHEIEGMGHDIPPALEEPIANLIAAHARHELYQSQPIT